MLARIAVQVGPLALELPLRELVELHAPGQPLVGREPDAVGAPLLGPLLPVVVARNLTDGHEARVRVEPRHVGDAEVAEVGVGLELLECLTQLVLV